MKGGRSYSRDLDYDLGSDDYPEIHTEKKLTIMKNHFSSQCKLVVQHKYSL